MVPFILLGLIISGVYYDPIQAENGGEAIQLENNGTTPVLLAQLVTKSAAYTLPSVTLLPGQGYLIADTGWSLLKDNATWPDADYEIGLSLANTESFVELRDNGTVLDHLAWNSSNGTKAREGYAFTHAGEVVPFFRNSNTSIMEVPATIEVLNTAPTITNITITDDASAPGIQLLSYNRTILLSARVADGNGDAISATATFLGKEYELVNENNTITGMIPFPGLVPGTYSITITAADSELSASHTEQITVLTSSSISVNGTVAFRGEPGTQQTATFTILNNGNTAKTILIQHTLPDANCDFTSVVLGPQEEKEVSCTATIPAAAPGVYEYLVRLIAA